MLESLRETQRPSIRSRRGALAPGAVSRPFRPHGDVFVVSGLCVIKMPQQFQSSAERGQVACFRLIASRLFPAITQDVSGIDRVDLAMSWHPCTRVMVRAAGFYASWDVMVLVRSIDRIITSW